MCCASSRRRPTADGGPSTTSTSAPTSAVTDITLAFTTAASVSGTAQEGQVLTAVNGTLNDSDASVSGYQWTRDGVNIAGANGLDLHGDRGRRDPCAARRRDGDRQRRRPKHDLDQRADERGHRHHAGLHHGGLGQRHGAGGPGADPVNGTLNDSDRLGLRLPVDAATASTSPAPRPRPYTVTEADETHVLRVVETATDSDGGPSATSTSAPTSAVADITLAFTTAASVSARRRRARC